MASAQSNIRGNILDRNRIGVVGADVFDAFLHVGLCGVRCLFFLRIPNEEGERQIELTGHLDQMLEFVAADFIDAEQIL